MKKEIEKLADIVSILILGGHITQDEAWKMIKLGASRMLGESEKKIFKK